MRSLSMMRNGNFRISTNIQPEKKLRLYWKRFIFSLRKEKIMASHYINGDRAIFLLFCAHQDTEYE